MKTFTLGLFGAALLVAFGAACGDDDDENTQLTGGRGGSGGSGGSTAGGGAGGAGPAGAGGGGSGGAGGQAIGTVTVVAKFDPTKSELPEGLAVDGNGTPYVGFAPTSDIVIVRTDGSARLPFAKLPTPPPTGFMTGLALDGTNNLYAALVSSDAATAPPGVYRISARTGGGVGGAGGAGGAGGGGPVSVTTPFAKHPAMTFPNGIALDEAAKFGYVTDSTGAIYRFGLDAAGDATPWAAADELKGGTTACDGSTAAFDIGANGLVRAGNTFFVSNTNKGTIVRIDRNPDGSAAAPTVFANDCAALRGADGLAPDGLGGVYVAVNTQNKIVRVDRDGAITTLAQGGELDFPASLAFQGNALYVTNLAFTSTEKKPALLRIEVQSRQ